MSQSFSTSIRLDDGAASRIFKVAFSADGATEVDGKPLAVDIESLGDGIVSLLLSRADGSVRSFRCVADTDAQNTQNAVLVEGRRFEYTLADPRSLRASSSGVAQAGPSPLKAPMPGRIIRVLVADGEAVSAGQGCVVIEAMKMQNELKAPRAGTVRELAAAVGETVASGAVLLIID